MVSLSPVSYPNIKPDALLPPEGGDRSGASQPHKHLQFFPTQTEDGPPIECLARAARIDKDGRCPPNTRPPKKTYL